MRNKQPNAINKVMKEFWAILNLSLSLGLESQSIGLGLFRVRLGLVLLYTEIVQY